MIPEPSPDQHARITGTVLLDGQPASNVLVVTGSARMGILFSDFDSTDAQGRFELLVRRNVSPRFKAEPHVVPLVAVARAPLVQADVLDSVLVTVTFASLSAPPPLTTLARPIELTAAAGASATRSR